jgi:hypothetical protein
MIDENPALLIVERRCGGWIAWSGPAQDLKIGVTGDTRENALARFDGALRQWQDILSQAREQL